MKEIVTRVSKKGATTIPTEVRRRLGLNAPGEVAWVLESDGRVTVRRPLSSISIDSVIGSVPPLPGRTTTDFEDQIEDAMEEEAERIVRQMRGLS